MQARIKEAIQAYIGVINRPLEEGEDGWTPPPTANMRDKHWSRHLRGFWPNYTSVRLEANKRYSEQIKWCRENAQFYWVANNQNMWYFSNRDSALLFKLTFGGEVGVSE